ncbi:hypothetical protein MKX08_007225, partial [Trichoderma sp. CBMAI-0020]
MMASFPSIKFGLMVGIGGGIPSPTHDIRLGDVVVSKPSGTTGGVIQYDFGKNHNGQLDPQGSLNKPPQALLTAVSALQALHLIRGNQIQTILSELKISKFCTQQPEQDRLFESDYSHVDGSAGSCEQCDKKRLVARPDRPDASPVVFYGAIASGNQVIKDAKTRDQLGQRHGVLCFEMEAAGLMDNFPCLVIRGICDYADSHKSKDWQTYAASTAAACAKELLGLIPEVNYIGNYAGPNSERQGIPFSEVPDFSSKPNFIMTKTLYGMGDLALASLIPDHRYPHLDALVARVVEADRDFSVSSEHNIHDVFHATSMPTAQLRHRFAKWFNITSDSITANNSALWQMQAEESRLYMLRQPRAIFKGLCSNLTVRQWLQDILEDQGDAHLLIGYRSVINANIVRQDRDATEQGGYRIDGERIYAICYRKVTFNFLRKVDSAHLGRDNCWKLFSDDRGGGNDENENESGSILEVDILDEDEVEKYDVEDN